MTAVALGRIAALYSGLAAAALLALLVLIARFYERQANRPRQSADSCHGSNCRGTIAAQRGSGTLGRCSAKLQKHRPSGARVRSGYPVFLFPAAALLLAGARYAVFDGRLWGDPANDWLRLAGGACLFGWGAYLVRLMTGRRQ